MALKIFGFGTSITAFVKNCLLNLLPLAVISCQNEVGAVIWRNGMNKLIHLNEIANKLL